jgi:hypothetical protein
MSYDAVEGRDPPEPEPEPTYRCDGCDCLWAQSEVLVSVVTGAGDVVRLHEPLCPECLVTVERR